MFFPPQVRSFASFLRATWRRIEKELFDLKRSRDVLWKMFWNSSTLELWKWLRRMLRNWSPQETIWWYWAWKLFQGDFWRPKWPTPTAFQRFTSLRNTTVSNLSVTAGNSSIKILHPSEKWMSFWAWKPRRWRCGFQVTRLLWKRKPTSSKLCLNGSNTARASEK